MMACKEATRLMSQGMDRKLTVAEQVSLKLHLALCQGCRHFNRHIHFIRHAARRMVDRTD
ncbi:hypothetical protein HNQ59_001269 [Chitinivorax tropicus]|uniref:Putative zinc-finger domain-containing protein n=1 Tax=Chitinivorax tropicus TaxID=714531 RepID=A0A840MFE8_9PROT|nr:zf-HC2 domain-containing protein [Chitinivorax tropicus]MBB5017984.1 hypothetical protein [Chitinivorax tropicus]